MALNKTPVAINFSRGLDQKSDPYQVPVGSFLTLVNSVFTKTGRLTKRLGFNKISALPNTEQTTLTTLNDNLIATGSSLYAYSKDTDVWLNQGTVQPVQLDTLSLVRNSTSQQSPDSAIASNGLCCLVYVDNNVAYYQVSDSETGQQVVQRTALPSTATNPRVFILGQRFIITFIATVAATPTLQYIAMPIATPGNPTAAINISANVSSLSAGYDAYVADDFMFIAWNQSAANIGLLYMTTALAQSAPVVLASQTADLMSVTVDTTQQVVWLSWWETATNNGYVSAYSYILGQLVTPTPIILNKDVATITSTAKNGVLSVFYQNENLYGYQPNGSPVRTDYISALQVTRPVTVTSGVVGPTSIILRSVGLASKAFINNGISYMLVEYGSKTQANSLDNTNQPTYFLINESGQIIARIAYSNGGGYAASQVLPSVSLFDSQYQFPYQITDFLTTVNKTTTPGQPVNAIYTQTGINLAKITLNEEGQFSSEIANALHLTGGQLWEYDGVRPVEHSFHVWPENIYVTTASTGGLITAQTYNYVFTYEWTDNQGMLHRSAPSIPYTIVTTGATSTNTIRVPTLRLTYKVSPNPVRIVGYRWSTAQQTYYQFTSVTSPTANNPAVDSVTITDTLADSAILGNTLLYTTGGVLENIAAPASIASALFDNRLWLIDAEDRNLLWFSKQVIQNVPVEMSDLLTLYVAPTTGAQGSTGPMTALSAMDEKLIIFKRDAIYYVNGNGPDNTGANSSYSGPVFITSTVGCTNPNSIVLIPNGIMFQSDKGIWMLGRDLTTQYIGAPVEGSNNAVVVSAEAVPETNQVRFVLDNNTTLMYDYFYNQWATHTNISAISACLYQGRHTYLNSYGNVFQESLDSYVDGSTPVLMSLTTSWINVAGLQGFERFYFANLLGTYYTPFKLNLSVSYDYNSSPLQSTLILPDNYSPAWGDEAVWGSGGPWGGGPGNVFSARFFPVKQKCQSFQITLQEVYDSSFGASPGQGLSLSGLALIVGMKRGFRTQKASRSFG